MQHPLPAGVSDRFLEIRERHARRDCRTRERICTFASPKKGLLDPVSLRQRPLDTCRERGVQTASARRTTPPRSPHRPRSWSTRSPGRPRRSRTVAGATRCPMTWYGTSRPSRAPTIRGSLSGSSRRLTPFRTRVASLSHHHSLRLEQGVGWSDGKGAVQIERWPYCRERAHLDSPFPSVMRQSHVRAVPAPGN